MSLLRRLRRNPSPSAESSELRRIDQYESTQREICATAGARFDPPDYRKQVALAPSVVAGHLPVRGSRHEGETVEWYVVADDESRPAVEEMSLQHLHHLATLREDLLLYLALPIGWSFVVLGDGLGTWAAFSPSDKLASAVVEFLSPDGSTATAEEIKDILDASFADLEPARDLSTSIDRYLAGELRPDDLEARLVAISEVVRGTPGDGRVE